MKRKDPYEPDPAHGFDMESWEEEQAEKNREVFYCENPYEDYDFYEAVIVEKVSKVVCVYARSKEEAEAYLRDNLDGISMEKDIEKYEKYIDSVSGSFDCSESDYTVPLDWSE